jgi:hypothetical protein
LCAPRSVDLRSPPRTFRGATFTESLPVEEGDELELVILGSRFGGHQN